ncbi:MAG TPA: hypothetical protein VG456_16855 [Candidatus Sulfopaludibacter sp.]|jgi:hypothetical protein|nr:hypothetical protein [Candidatus Sulfopaludibacter sp.]
MKGKRDSGCELGQAFDQSSPTFMRLHFPKAPKNHLRNPNKPNRKLNNWVRSAPLPRDPDQHPADAAFDAIERELAALLKPE